MTARVLRVELMILGGKCSPWGDWMFKDQYAWPETSRKQPLFLLAFPYFI